MYIDIFGYNIHLHVWTYMDIVSKDLHLCYRTKIELVGTAQANEELVLLCLSLCH